MKFSLRKDEFNPGLPIVFSMALIVAGVIVYYTVSTMGVMFVLMGLAGLCWCLLPRW